MTLNDSSLKWENHYAHPNAFSQLFADYARLRSLTEPTREDRIQLRVCELYIDGKLNG